MRRSTLLSNLDRTTFLSRNEQEVAGHGQAMDLVFEAFCIVEQGALIGKTEAFQFYKSELFNNAQKDKLGSLLKSRRIASGRARPIP